MTTAKIADSNVTTAKIADSNVTTAKIAADAVTNAKIADDSIDSEHYVDGSIDTAHIANDAVTTDKINLVSTSSVPSLEAKGDGSSQDGYIKLNCSQNSHGVKIQAPPHSAAANYTLTLPNTDGTNNQVLKTDGSGALDWVDPVSYTHLRSNET